MHRACVHSSRLVATFVAFVGFAHGSYYSYAVVAAAGGGKNRSASQPYPAKSSAGPDPKTWLTDRLAELLHAARCDAAAIAISIVCSMPCATVIVNSVATSLISTATVLNCPSIFPPPY